MRLRVAVTMTLLAGWAACGGPGEQGEECYEERVADECVEGAICVEDVRGGFTCRREAAIGESCSFEGHRAECVGEAICGKDVDGGIECLQICDSADECPNNWDCNGVEGSSLKGCRLK
jgi:hypothetical protein